MGTPEVARDADRLIAFNDEYQQTEALLKSLYDEWDRVRTRVCLTQKAQKQKHKGFGSGAFPLVLFTVPSPSGNDRYRFPVKSRERVHDRGRDHRNGRFAAAGRRLSARHDVNVHRDWRVDDVRRNIAVEVPLLHLPFFNVIAPFAINCDRPNATPA